MIPRVPKRPLRLQPAIVPITDIVFSLVIFFMLIPSVSGGNGFLTANLPDHSGPNLKDVPPPPPWINVRLEDVGPQGEFVPGQPNEFCAIRYENQELGGNFEALAAVLKEKIDRGLDSKMRVVIRPTIGCRHRWVVRAFDTIAAAGFTRIEFAVPYDVQE